MKVKAKTQTSYWIGDKRGGDLKYIQTHKVGICESCHRCSTCGTYIEPKNDGYVWTGVK